MNASKNSDQLALVTIYEVSKLLNAATPLNSKLQQVLNIMSAQLNMQRGIIWLKLHPERLTIAASAGIAEEDIECGELAADKHITEQVFKHSMAIVIPDIHAESRFFSKAGAARSKHDSVYTYIGVPIKAQGNTLGVLSFQYSKKSSFQSCQAKLQILSMAANIIGQSIHLHQRINSEQQQLIQENTQLQKAFNNKYEVNRIVGESRQMQSIMAQVKMAAPNTSTVLLRGESGTGKEMIAHALHQLSSRANKPFIRLNCASLSENLLESELFGHEKGAFTGALQQRKGRFEQAHGGTLFLDEIGDISPAFQVKLLRVLQEQEFERVGGNHTIKVDVRLICATHRNLEVMVSNGTFRADLYYRMHVISIHLPPLRERLEDIPILAEQVLSGYNLANQTKKHISKSAMHVLLNCQWPGNIRELENCVTRVCTLSREDVIDAKDMPCQSNSCISIGLWQSAALQMPPVKNHETHPTLHDGAITNDRAITAHETTKSARDQLIDAMNACGWVQAKAARMLNLTSRQLGYALKKHHIIIKKL